LTMEKRRKERMVKGKTKYRQWGSSLRVGHTVQKNTCQCEVKVWLKIKRDWAQRTRSVQSNCDGIRPRRGLTQEVEARLSTTKTEKEC